MQMRQLPANTQQAANTAANGPIREYAQRAHESAQKSRPVVQQQQQQVQLQPVQKNENAKKPGTSSSSKKLTYNIIGEKVIGSGTFGVVYQAKIQETDEPVAIKKVFQDKRYKNRELQMMQEMKAHPNVISLRHHFFTYGNDPDEVYLNLIMEYIPETLYRLIKYYNRRKREPMPNILIKLYSYQLIRSLAYIHGIGVCHRDIKPTNVLVDPRTHVLKLCDFGSAKKLTRNEQNISYICSRYYRAPELMFGATNYNNQIDTWSTGCVIAEMILGEAIFQGESSVDQLVEIIKILGTPNAQQVHDMNPSLQQINLPPIKGRPWKKVFKGYDADPLLVDLVSKLLVYSPHKRLRPLEALAHPYFNELRLQNCRINRKPLPDLFNFMQEEVGDVKLEFMKRLIPQWYAAQMSGQEEVIDGEQLQSDEDAEE